VFLFLCCFVAAAITFIYIDNILHFIDIDKSRFRQTMLRSLGFLGAGAATASGVWQLYNGGPAEAPHRVVVQVNNVEKSLGTSVHRCRLAMLVS
jgi:hypothetical protein